MTYCNLMVYERHAAMHKIVRPVSCPKYFPASKSIFCSTINHYKPVVVLCRTSRLVLVVGVSSDLYFVILSSCCASQTQAVRTVRYTSLLLMLMFYTALITVYAPLPTFTNIQPHLSYRETRCKQ